jgi:spore germination protein GerM
MKSNLGAFLALLALSSLVLMMGYQKYTPKREPAVTIPSIKVEPKEPTVRPHRQPPSEGAGRTAKTSEVTLFIPRATKNQEMRLDRVTAKSESATPLGALRALASYEGEGEMESPLPKGTKVLGLTVGPDGTATADFSHEIVDNFPGGSETEQLLLGSIANTLTQFPTIKRVKILVDGKRVDSIGGHIELDEPIERDPDLMLKPSD